MEATLIYPALAQTPTRTVVVWLSHPTPDPRWLLKRQDSIPAGARWITVHPNGKGEKGQRVLIQETSPGSGVHRVIGGAGGSLNYLKMTGVRSEAEYRRTAADRKKAKAEQRKEQRKQDKALGLEKPKQEAKARIDEALAKKRAEIIQQAAAAMGWEGHQFDPEPYQDLSKEAQTKAYREHQAEWLGKAREAIDVQRKALLHDHEARAEVLPEVPVASDEASVISLPDLAPEPSSSSAGLGYRVDYRGEAEKHGHTETAIQAEKAALDAQAPVEVQEATAKRRATVEAIKTELASARADEAPKDAPIKLLKAEQAAELLKADKALRMLEQQARKAKQKINESTELPGAAVLEVSGEEVDEALKKEFDEDLRVASTTAFLSEASKLGTTAKHLGIGAYNSLNALSVAVAGVGLVDRMTLDVLGVAATADVLARRLHHDLGPDEAARIHDAVTDYHKDHYLRASEQAVSEAMRWQTAAEGLAVEAAESGADLARMQEINTKRREAIEQAQRIMGQTLGEMEANAALVLALGRKPKEQIELSLGQRSTESAVRRVRALGLQPGDYEIHSVGSERFLTLRGSGMDKLAESIDAEGERVTRRALAIQAGKEDVDGWLPEGMADRPDLAAKSAMAPGVAPRFAEPFRPGPDMAQSVRDYVGARAADGDTARDIVADLRADDMVRKAGERSGEYWAAVDQLAPLRGPDGKRLNADVFQNDFERLADEYVQRRFGVTRTPLHKQDIPTDETAVEALHRALAAHPEGVLAFKAVGDLTAKDQGALRLWWDQEYGTKDAVTAQKAQELAEHLGKEPDRWLPDTTDEWRAWHAEGTDIQRALDKAAPGSPERASLEAQRRAHAAKDPADVFAQVGESPAWAEWSRTRDQLSSELKEYGLRWKSYATIMGGPVHAYEAVQDIIRGQVSRAFADTYDTLSKTPLKIGRALVKNHIRHLDAVDPASREKRLKELSQLKAEIQGHDIGGGWASGKVADKMDDAKAEREAFAQAQMGLFGDGLDFGAPPVDLPLAPGQRYTLGVPAERTLAGMAGIVGHNFRPGKPVKLWHSSMDGKYVNGQRAVKLLENSKRLILSQGVGSGKAQPLDAKLLTPTGWVAMRDAYVGMPIIAGDGSVSQITGVYPQGEKDIYRVVMSDGGSTECCDEHLWWTTTEIERKRIAKGGSAGEVRSLSEIRKSLIVRHGIRNHHIPLHGVPEFSAKDVPIDPYLLGLLLGDGCIAEKGYVQFASEDDDIIQAVQERLPDGCFVIQNKPDKCSYRITQGTRSGVGRKKNRLSVLLLELGLGGGGAFAKFVPDVYLFNSYDVRLNVLRGLMDTDGCAEAKGVHITFCTISPRLADAVEFLTQSLGGVSRRKTKTPKYTYKGECRVGALAYILTLTLPPNVNPFLMTRKSSSVVPKTKYAPKSRIISDVQYVGKKQAQCIAISHPSQLYVTDDFIVTHNTKMSLAAFAHLHQQGKVKHGLYAVPSVVQGQFGGEALRYLEPNTFKWHAEPGASREERLAAYKDPDTHFTVVTHQSLRDDLVYLGAQQAGISESEMAEQVRAMSGPERKTWMRGVMDGHGMDHDFLMVDEGHDLLDRAGKETSLMAGVIDAVAHNTPYYISASADPIKNDPSEAFSLLSKVDPERYHDPAAFKRRYGVDTPAAQTALRREMARYHFPGKIEPGVDVRHEVREVALSEAQHAEIKTIERAAGQARLARIKGEVDIDAIKTLSPSSFAGVDAGRHREVAEALSKNLGIIKDSAVRRAINEHPASAKLDQVSELAKAKRGTPGVIFAHSRAAVAALERRLTADGHRVVTVTGADSAKDKDRKRLQFHPESGEPEADILIASDAGATGLNLQRGQWLAQYDTPDTAKGWHQRNGRIARLGQKNNVDLIDLVGDHPVERRARERLARKDELRQILTTPLDTADDTGIAAYLNRASVEQQQASLF